MSILPPRTDWHGRTREHTSVETALIEGTARRIRREAEEIRTAAEQLADGTAVEREVAAFLRVQATLLERAGATPDRTAYLRPEENTQAVDGMFPTAARSALLIARAHHADRTDPR
ncbi:hypothetical protein [Streptomyces niveiscabiei]|uniref:hypothetical protein n=1 Tax=Streptomyces niveiscabiei TaxID=164115 RepID=UPI0038F70D61